MKFTSATCLGLVWTAASSILTGVEAVRGSSATEPDFLQSLKRNHVRHLKSDSGDTAGGAGGAGGQGGLLDDGQCLICTKEVNGFLQSGERPDEIRARYIGGKGAISGYQDEEKATCRDQDFPMEGTVEMYGETLPFSNGQEFIIKNPNGGLDAETDFVFPGLEPCYIHTSCSQPLVAGDRIGPWLLLEANGCVYEECGDGIINGNETCDCSDFLVETTCTYINGVGSGCRDDCTYCGDGTVNAGEECDDGAANGALTSGCREDCTLSECGDGILDLAFNETCDCTDFNNPSTCIYAMDGGSGCRPDCTHCGDGFMDMGEECDDGANGIDSDGCRDDCTLLSCGDGEIATELGETCDCTDFSNEATCEYLNDVDGMGCRDDCTYCGDGNLDMDMGEECDEGAANGDLANNNGCRADCTLCKCQASAEYDNDSGAVTIDFDMCGEEPLKSDFIGIYPCDAPTMTADQTWWNDKVCRQFPGSCATPFDYGYTESEIYVNELYTWFSWTCGSPLPPQAGGCQANGGTTWPGKGQLVLDPANAARTPWAFLRGASLADGCYKVVMQREMKFISPPPYPTICLPWEQALTFQVPNQETSQEQLTSAPIVQTLPETSPPVTTPVMQPLPEEETNTTTSVTPLETAPRSESSGSRGISTIFVSIVSFLVLYYANK